MQASLFERVLNLLSRRRSLVQDIFFLLTFLTVCTLIAYRFDIFPGRGGRHPDLQVIELDEALALVAVMFVGLLILSWRFVLAQRREINRRVTAERLAREMALQDSLTGLPNRRRFDQELKTAVAAPPRTGGSHALFLLDLNGFKRVNDLYGHSAGDDVLIHVSMRLQRAVRQGDLVARFGGDEFAILARHLSGPEDATNIALRVIAEMRAPIVLNSSSSHHIGIGIGIVLIPQDANSETEALRKADVALYRAKGEQHSSSRFFEPEMDEKTRERDLLERELRDAIADGRIHPRYQPLVDLKTKKIVGFEALARWKHPTLGFIPPERFLPIAESRGLMNTLTDHLLRVAARDAREWPASTILSFNISPSQLRDQTLGLRILTILSGVGLSPWRLELEITESAIVQDLESAQNILGTLRDAGVRIALDDFGTGYSSLYHLRNFTVDKIKIDRSFVDDIKDGKQTNLLKALLGLGHGLGLVVTAEGVEQAAQAMTLEREGCQQAQGYLYGEAVPAEDAKRLLVGEMSREDTTVIA